MRSTPKFSIGDFVYVTCYDTPGRDSKDGLVIRGPGAITSVQTMDKGDTTIRYTIENVRGNRAERACWATLREAVVHKAQWWRERAVMCQRRADQILEEYQDEDQAG